MAEQARAELHSQLEASNERLTREAREKQALQRELDAANTALPAVKADTANVEIAICAMAARFLGTKTSSFTLAISEERQSVFGHAADTNEEMGELPKEERAAAPSHDEL